MGTQPELVTAGLSTIAELAADLVAVVERLEADVESQRAAGAEIADQVHALRLRSESLFS